MACPRAQRRPLLHAIQQPSPNTNKRYPRPACLWIWNSSGTDTWSRNGRGGTGADSGELLISYHNGFQELMLLGIGEEITGKQFACLLGGRFVPVESSEMN